MEFKKQCSSCDNCVYKNGEICSVVGNELEECWYRKYKYFKNDKISIFNHIWENVFKD